jgi:uncharacterized damage-inducible protein DinB
MRPASLIAALTLGLLSATPSVAQTASENVYAQAARTQFGYIQDLLAKAAEKAGEDVYSFKPTPEVRSFAGVLGHAADGNVLLCKVASGQTDIASVLKDLPSFQTREKKTAKADVIAALKESRAVCESVFAQLDDVSGKQKVAWFGDTQMPKLLVLMQATSHSWEHYGNLVTYMRLKGIVPPSSEGQPPPPKRSATETRTAETGR